MSCTQYNTAKASSAALLSAESSCVDELMKMKEGKSREVRERKNTKSSMKDRREGGCPFRCHFEVI